MNIGIYLYEQYVDYDKLRIKIHPTIFSNNPVSLSMKMGVSITPFSRSLMDANTNIPNTAIIRIPNGRGACQLLRIVINKPIPDKRYARKTKSRFTFGPPSPLHFILRRPFKNLISNLSTPLYNISIHFHSKIGHQSQKILYYYQYLINIRSESTR